MARLLHFVIPVGKCKNVKVPYDKAISSGGPICGARCDFWTNRQCNGDITCDIMYPGYVLMSKGWNDKIRREEPFSCNFLFLPFLLLAFWSRGFGILVYHSWNRSIEDFSVISDISYVVISGCTLSRKSPSQLDHRF